MTTKLFIFLFAMLCLMGYAQENAEKKSDSINKPLKRLEKIDGVTAVVGSYVILESEIARAHMEMQNQGMDMTDITKCKLLDRLMEDKLYAHHAIQDSISIADENVKQYVDKQIEYFLQQLDNNMSKLLQFYGKESEKQLRDELIEVNKQLQLSQRMKAKITEETEITPEEVHLFFKKISKNDPPFFGTVLEVSQIVIEPKIPDSETNRIIERLMTFKEDIEERSASFASKALLYSQDPGSRSRGGLYTITKKSPMAKEFKDAAFSLQEGEISDPFKSDFGWHILKVDKIRGKEYDVRHILLIPEPSLSAIREAYQKISKIRQRILDNEITFKEAVLEFSDEKETKYNDGKLINPTTLDTKFELTKIDSRLYSQIEKLKKNEITPPILEEEVNGNKKYKIIKIANRIDEHFADYSKDYNKIHDLALTEKKQKLVDKWVKDKILDTYIYISNEFKRCKLSKNWLKNQ